MSDHDTDVLNDPLTKPKRESKRANELKHEQGLVLEQNTLYFTTIGLKNSKKDQSKVGKSRENKGKLENYAKEQQEKLEQEKSGLRFQALYEDLLQKFDTGIKTLAQAGPGTDTIADEVRRTRKTARQLVKGDKPNYKLAYETLQKQNLDKISQGVPTLVKKANELFETQAKKSYEECNVLKEKLRTAPLSQGVKEDFEQKLLAATALAKVPAKDPGKLDTNCFGKLQSIGTELDRVINDAETAKKDCGVLFKTGTGLTKLQGTAPGNLEEFNDAVIADLRRKRQNAGTTYDLMDYPLALATLRAVADECREWQQKLDAELIGSYRDWAEQKGALKAARTQADKLANSTTAPKELVDQAAQLAKELGELAAAKPNPGRECNAAVDRFETLKIRLGGLTIRTTDGDGFPAVKADACKPNDDKLIEVATALNNLEQKLTKRKDIDQALRDKALGPLKVRLKDILNEWTDRKLKAFDPVSLDARTIADELRALAADIADAGDDDEIAVLAKSPELERAQSELRAAMDEAMKVQLKIMSFNPEEGLANRAFLKQVSQMLAASDDPSLLDSVRDQLLREIDRQTGLAVFADKRIDELRTKIDEHLKPVPPQLNEQGTLIGKLRGGDTRAAFEAMQGTLQTEYESVVAMSLSDQISVLEQAVADAEELALEASNFLLELKRKPVDDPYEPTGVKELRDLFLFLEKMLNVAKTAEEYMIVTYSAIEERLKLAQENLGKSTMAAMTKELRAIRKAIDDMCDEAEKAKERYKDGKGFQAEVTAIEKQLEDRLFTGNAPAYVKKAKADLETLKKNAKFEGGYEGATADAVKMKIELGKMLRSARNARDIPVLIVEKETEIKGENAKDELQKTKWEAELEIIKNDLDASKSINPKEIKGLKSVVRDAKKAVEKSTDYGMGRSQLEQVRTKLALLQQNPAGLAVAARNQLPGVNALYRKVVMEFGKTLSDLEKTVSEQLEDADKRAFAKEVVEVRGLLNPALFMPYIKTITTAEDDEKRSTAREKALRGVRQMMTYVKKDYRMRELARAPATVDSKMAGVISKVFLALLNLENNLLVSL